MADGVTLWDARNGKDADEEMRRIAEGGAVAVHFVELRGMRAFCAFGGKTPPLIWTSNDTPLLVALGKLPIHVVHVHNRKLWHPLRRLCNLSSAKEHPGRLAGGNGPRYSDLLKLRVAYSDFATASKLPDAVRQVLALHTKALHKRALRKPKPTRPELNDESDWSDEPDEAEGVPVKPTVKVIEDGDMLLRFEKPPPFQANPPPERKRPRLSPPPALI
eukprot:Sspe_Gene.96169::Locus_68657_Transcript_1_1_Confidence_1.000_Length_808::g.96169::m.96169